MDSIFRIGDIVEDKNHFLYLILNQDTTKNTVTIVKKSGHHNSYSDYENDTGTDPWDLKHTEYNIKSEFLTLVKSRQDQLLDG